MIILKYLIILCDGMADTADKSFLNGKTPMECAKLSIDYIKSL